MRNTTKAIRLGLLLMLLGTGLFAQVSWQLQPSPTLGEIGGVADFSFSVRVGGTFQSLGVVVQRAGGGNVSNRFSIISQSIGNVIGSGGNFSTGEYTVRISNLTASDVGAYFFQVTANGLLQSPSSQQVQLSVVAALPPTITRQPQSITVSVGGVVALSVEATGSGLAYLWRKDGVNLVGANGAVLSLSNLQLSQTGIYSVVVSNAGGAVTSASAALTVIAVPPPVIALQPQSMIVNVGDSATLSVLASGSNLTYQWRKDGNNIPGAVASVLMLPNIELTQAGAYSVVISNLGGIVASATANITVTNISIASRISNLSIRTRAGSGAETLIVGFVVGGGFVGTKPLLMRAVGPTLAMFGVSGSLNDPKISLFRSDGTVILENDDWGGNTQVAQVGAQVGAFPFGSVVSKDAALYEANVGRGSYSVQISGNARSEGVALAEIYDATPLSSFTPSTARLVNVSARAQVGIGDDILIAGFVIGGSTNVRVLIRSIGPTLTSFGVTGVLENPRLDVFSGATRIFENEDWGGSTALNQAFLGAGAFSLPSNSRDAALLVSLAPGSYTVQVRGSNGGTGVALVEVYEVP